jgi:hypothetical protein
MKDLFVSYGRRESLVFVGKLHQQLRLSGYEVWFDKVNIPDGDDYSQRISHGIESAHNFAYVMAPRCLTSPYCLIELEYAKLLGKRIIPLAQIIIFETPPKELSETDKQVLKDFYRTNHIADLDIQTELDVLKRSHTLLGKTDWIYAREEYTDKDIEAMFAWQTSYENSWHKHDELIYLQETKFPDFGRSIDNLAGVCDSLLRVIEKHKSYTIKHTEILLAALVWQQRNQITEALLVGKERKEADEWLLTEFVAPEQAPCVASDLHAEFICESRKNAENLYTDAFVCYDIANKVLREKVYKSLSKAGITTWIHHRDIAKSENYEEAINRGIEQADSLLFFISNDSMQSEYCLKELQYAISLNKRIIPLLVEVLNPEMLKVYKNTKKLQEIQYIDFTNNHNEENYQNDIRDILREIHRDRRYHEQHKVFLVQALKWENQGKNPSILLRGYNLQNAQTWLKTSSKRTAQKPLPLQEAFIQESAAHAGEENIDVFISYSRNDGDFARKLNEQLQINGRSTWFDQDSIASGADFQKEIYKGITSSNNFVFLISQKSIESPYCADEVAYAALQGKRIITLRVEPVATELLPPALASVQWIEAGKDKDFAGIFSQLIRTLDIDRTHVESHSKWQNKALEWKTAQKDAALLLLGSEFSVAELWLQESLKDKKQPQPTAIQQEFIEESRKAIEQTAARETQIASVLEKRLKMMRLALGASAILLFAALIATGFAFFAMRSSDKSAEIASLATESAKEEAHRADSLNKISISTAGRLSSFQGQTFRLINYVKLQYDGKNYRDSIRAIIAEIDPASKAMALFRDAFLKCGFKDLEGNILIPAFFDEAEEFKDKKANVRIGEGRYVLYPDGTKQIAQENNGMWEWQTVQKNTGTKTSTMEKVTSKIWNTLAGKKQKKEEPKKEVAKNEVKKKETKTEEKPKSRLGRLWSGIVGKGKDEKKDEKKDDNTKTETVKNTEKKEETTTNTSKTREKTVEKIVETEEEEIIEDLETNANSKGKYRIPRNAVSATLNPNDPYNMYVMRSKYKDMTQKMWGLESGLQVGYVTSENAVYSYNGNAMETNTMQVLVLKAPRDQFAWVDMNMIKNFEAKGWAKLQAGWEEIGNPIFVSRTRLSNGEYVIGKATKGCAMYPQNGKEITNCEKFEVLMYQMPSKELEQIASAKIEKTQKYKIEYLQNHVGKIVGLGAEPFADWKWVTTERPANFKFKIPIRAYEIANTDTIFYVMRVQREDGSMYLGNLSENLANYAYMDIAVETRFAQLLVIDNKSKFEWVAAGKKDSYFAENYALVQGGWETDGKPLYIARAKVAGKYKVGQIVGNVCKIATGKTIANIQEYEVLMYKK